MLVFVVAATKIQALWRGWCIRSSMDREDEERMRLEQHRHEELVRLSSARAPESWKRESIGRYASEQALIATREAERARALVAAARSQLPAKSR